MLRFTCRHLGSLVAAAVLCSCEGMGAVGPLPGGSRRPVTLETSISAASGAAPHLQFVGGEGAIQVVWDVESMTCLLTEASALQAGPVIEIRLLRSGDPAALCIGGNAAYHYVARVPAVAPGRYAVRLVDETLGQEPRAVGSRLVFVQAVP